MTSNTRGDDASENIPGMSYATLLVILFTMLVLMAPLATAGYRLLAGTGLSMAILSAAALSVTGRTWLRFSAVLLLAVPVGSEILVRTIGTKPFLILGTATLAAYLAFIIALILRHILSGRTTTLNSVMGGACVYLLLGNVFYLLFCLIENIDRGAFMAAGEQIRDLGGAAHPEGRYPDLLYFSIVTFTTLGYGDIVPVSPFARSLATAAAVTGQLYLAIMMAGLVSLHLLGREER